jgi:hypothetical protein
MYPTDRNTVLGAGYLFFDELLNATTSQYAGERYIANTPSFELTVTAGGNIKDYDADGCLAVLNMDVDTMIDRTASFVGKHINGANLALFLPGTVSTRAPAAGALTAQLVNGGAAITRGYWYQLGADIYPEGIRAITGVAVKKGATTFVKDTDYNEDLTMGRIYITPTGGTIATGDILTADFTKTDVDWEYVSADVLLTSKRGRLKFISCNVSGSQRDVLIKDCVLTPNGPIAFKSRDTVQQLAFNCRIQTPSDGTSPIIITTRAA